MLKKKKQYEIDESFSSGESQSDEPKNEDYENRWDVETSCMNYSRNTNSESLDPGSIVEQTYAEKVTLKSILTNQAHLEFSNEKDRRISEILIDYIEPSGWFLQSLDEIESFSGFERNAIESVLRRMQKFEPSGVFARNLKECLSIQLQNTDSFSEKNITVVENLELLGEGNLKELQKITGMREEELKESIRRIRLLNPKPGLKYSDENLDLLSPDVIVMKNNNEWSVELNNSTLPKITVNNEYIREIESLKCNETDKKFISKILIQLNG